MGNEKLRAAVAQSAFSSQNVTHQLRTTAQSSSSDVEKWHPAAARSTFPIQKKNTALFSCCYYRYFPSPTRACPRPRLHKHIGRAGLHPHVCFFPPVQARVPSCRLKKQGVSEDCDQGHLLALLKSTVMFDQNDFAQRPPSKAIPLYRKVVIFKHLPHPHRIGPAPKHDARRTCGRGRQARDVRDASQAGRGARPGPFYNRTSCHLDKA